MAIQQWVLVAMLNVVVANCSQVDRDGGMGKGAINMNTVAPQSCFRYCVFVTVDKQLLHVPLCFLCTVYHQNGQELLPLDVPLAFVCVVNMYKFLTLWEEGYVLNTWLKAPPSLLMSTINFTYIPTLHIHS